MSDKQYIPCGGCGATDPIDRCIGCFHPFEPGEEYPQAIHPEDHEQVEINKAAGMPDNEASFQAGYAAGHDAGYKKMVQEYPDISVDELWDEYSEQIDDDIDSLTRWAGSVVIDKENFKKLMLKIDAAGSGKEEWDSKRLIGRVGERYKELEAKGWEWRSFYNGWLEGRADMFVQARGLGQYSGKEEAVAFAEWCRNNYQQAVGGWRTWPVDPEGFFTDEQLYEIYKQSK